MQQNQRYRMDATRGKWENFGELYTSNISLFVMGSAAHATCYLQTGGGELERHLQVMEGLMNCAV